MKAIFVLVALATVVAATTTAAIGKTAAKECGVLDGRFDVVPSGGGSWAGGTAAPGVTIVSASDQRIVFAVANDFAVTGLCVKTGSELNNYRMDATLPVSGPRQVTVTKVVAGMSQISFDTQALPPCGSNVSAPDVGFEPPVFIDRQRAGGEPVSVVAQDGSISVSAHAGTTHVYKNPDALPGSRDFLLGYTNQTLNWRSVDGGRTWSYTGLAGQREGPHSVSSTGFSDPDYAMDQAGNLYNVEIDLANDAVYKSPDDGQSWPIATPLAAPGDRPWVTALEPNEVFLYVNSLPKSMQVSRDPNLLVWERLPAPPVTSKSVPDPLNPDNGMIGPVGLGQFAISGDDAHTWQTHDFGPLGKARQFFGVVAVDNAGNVYQAAAGGYNGANDTTPDGQVTFTYYNRQTGETNTDLIEIPMMSGDALWPWIVAGDDGRVAVVWYQNLAGHPNEFYIFGAFTKNAHGTTVKCSDGSTKAVPPKWTVENISGRPVHLGKICLEGTTCNANPSFEAGDRRLGDFFTVNYDLDGNLIIASGDTTLDNPLGGAKPVGNPIFIRQSSGDKMLEQPIQPRETRCLYPIPSC